MTIHLSPSDWGLCGANGVCDNRKRMCLLRLNCIYYTFFTTPSLLHCAEVMPKDGAGSESRGKGVRPPTVGSLNLKPILRGESKRD